MVATRFVPAGRYTGNMTNDEHLQRHLELCKRVYERMKREGSWPWSDSPKSEDLVDSDDTKTDL